MKLFLAFFVLMTAQAMSLKDFNTKPTHDQSVYVVDFIEKPFQNWTRTSADIMGSVFVWVDYTFPVEEGRKALKAIIEASPLWDRRFWNLQVSDATEKTMQLRVLATSSDSSRSWDLRCEIREKFIAYIQLNHPGGLPRFRAEGLGRPSPGPAGIGRAEETQPRQARPGAA